MGAVVSFKFKIDIDVYITESGLTSQYDSIQAVLLGKSHIILL